MCGFRFHLIVDCGANRNPSRTTTQPQQPLKHRNRRKRTGMMTSTNILLGLGLSFYYTVISWEHQRCEYIEWSMVLLVKLACLVWAFLNAASQMVMEQGPVSILFVLALCTLWKSNISVTEPSERITTLSPLEMRHIHPNGIMGSEPIALGLLFSPTTNASTPPSFKQNSRRKTRYVKHGKTHCEKRPFIFASLFYYS